MGFLFPRLPDEIGSECLVRVELNSHHKLRCVCKSWNAALKSPGFYERRKVLKLSEQRICFLDRKYGTCRSVEVFNPETNSCKSLLPIPLKHGAFRCHFVKQKLILIPNMFTDPTRNHVWLYDFAAMKWKKGAKMTRWMNRFASAVDEHAGLIYVAGGFGSYYIDRGCGRIGDLISSASVYNVEEDEWEDLPDMNACMGIFLQGVFGDGKFYVIKSLECFQVFDSYTRCWKTMETTFNLGKSGIVGRYVSAFGNVYCFSDGRVIEYDCSQNKVQIVGSLPGEDSDRFVEFAIMVGDKIFVRKCGNTLGVCMLPLPSETGGTFKWIDIQSPPNLNFLARDAAAILDL